VPARANSRMGERADERAPRDSERRERAPKGSRRQQIGPTRRRERGGVSGRGAALTSGARLLADVSARVLGRVSWAGLGREAEREGISSCFPFLFIF
jgi:hypothetical protein